ncbi:MAG: hypothetical protein IKL51_11090 [Lachnospiraceae bacterium]|nr:hypothetical protein [Lachnospiraceae bacterium]
MFCVIIAALIFILGAVLVLFRKRKEVFRGKED